MSQWCPIHNLQHPADRGDHAATDQTAAQPTNNENNNVNIKLDVGTTAEMQL